MSNEPKDPQPKPHALLGVANPATPSATPVSRPDVKPVERFGIQPVAYVPPPAKPPTGDGGAQMVSE